jgi:TonB family protein
VSAVFTANHSGSRRTIAAQLASFSLHALALFGVLLFLNRVVTHDDAPPVATPLGLVYMLTPGPSGGGGGSPAPSAPAELRVPPPVATVIVPADLATPPPQSMDAPVVTDPTAILQANGFRGFEPAKLGGGGPGTGSGPGPGRGLGPGETAGTGGGPPRPGAGISMPIRLREIKPQYTAEAMQLKIQGSVELEAIVGTEGRVTAVRVLRSLDRMYGLDEAAKRAALATPFISCKKEGVPVACLVTFELQFTIR